MAVSLEKNLLMIASMDGNCKIFNTNTWSLIKTLVPPGQAAIRTCHVSQDSKLVILAGDDDMAHIFDLENGNFGLLKSLKGHEATVFWASFSHDSSHMITGDNDGVILIWNWHKDKCVSRVDDAHDLGVTCGDCMPSKGKPDL